MALWVSLSVSALVIGVSIVVMAVSIKQGERRVR